MNAPIIDPLQGDFPELIEEYLEHGIMKCIAFNRRGTLLAAGCSDGSCVVWDFQTRGIAKELRDEDCVAAITSVCWSKSGYHILVSAADNSLTLWNVEMGIKVFQTTLQQTPLQARLHPGGGSSPPSLCLVSPFSSAPFILDLHTQIATALPISSPDSGIHNKFSDGSAHYTPTAACFNKSGDLVYLGNSTGEILIIDHKNNQIRGIVPISGGGVIKNIVFSRNGQYLLTNSSDRIIRVYDNLLPLKDSLKSLEVHERENENLKDVGLKCLSLFREFQDSITKVHWKAPCFSGDSAWVVGGSASIGEHKIFIWDQAGLLVKLLEGPKEALVDLAWHPVRPFVVSVSLTGLVYIWAKDYTENWSAFAPDFKELEENEEYVEQEDEFDLMPETEKVKESYLNEDVEVDIVTVEKDSAFSDSDISQDELCYLPTHPSPDVPEKLPESYKPGSPLSVDSSETEVVENSAPEDIDRAHLKRRRKRSKKLLELQDFKGTEKTKASDCSYVESVSTQNGDESLTGFKEAKSPSKGALRSMVWDHFKKFKKSNNKAVAVCNYCGKKFVAGDAGTSNLRHHLKRKHAELIVSADCSGKESVSTAELIVSADDDKSKRKYKKIGHSARKRKRSEVWNYFKTLKKPNNKMIAICNFCSMNFVAGVASGTNHLRNHLKRKHSKHVQLVVSLKS